MQKFEWPKTKEETLEYLKTKHGLEGFLRWFDLLYKDKEMTGTEVRDIFQDWLDKVQTQKTGPKEF
jgi:hypothetical protein